MKSRRELMLEEMGLTPVWRLRDSAVAEEVPPAEPAGDPAAPVTPHQSPIRATAAP